MKILLAVDGSAYTKRMLAYIAAHDELLGPRHDYTAIAVVPAVPPHVRSYLDKSVVDDYYADEAKSVLDPVRAFAAQHGWRLETAQAVGHAPDLIAETATNGRYDLVVMGSHGHTALGGLVLGSVTSRVLASCAVPILIVR